jgi:type IV pilus assembly protein PilV
MKAHGFSLIEILFTIFISSVGILGIGVLQLEAIKVSNDANAQSHASLMMRSIISRMRINTHGAKENAYLGVNSCDTPSPKMCGSYFLATRVQPGACSASELARYDEWDVVCGFPAEKSKFYGANHYVSNAQLTIRCSDSTSADTDACSLGSKINLTLKWYERSAKTNEDDFSRNRSIDTVIYL